MSTKNWRSQDGLKIPHHSDASRKAWDKKYHQAVVDVFGGGDPERLRKLRIPTGSASGSNMAVNSARLKLYTRMATGGDRLPPVVVRRSGNGYNLIDGNHRQEAAQAAGLKHLDAFEILDPVKKSLLKAEDPQTLVDNRLRIRDVLNQLNYQQEKGKEPGSLTGFGQVIEDAHYLADEDPQIKADVQEVLLHPQLNPEDARQALSTVYGTQKGPNLDPDFFTKAVKRWKDEPEVLMQIGSTSGIPPEAVHGALKGILNANKHPDPEDRATLANSVLRNPDAPPESLRLAIDDYHLSPQDWEFENPLSRVVTHPRFGELDPAWVQNHLRNSFEQGGQHQGAFAEVVAHHRPEMVGPDLVDHVLSRHGGLGRSSAFLENLLNGSGKAGKPYSPALTPDNLVRIVKTPKLSLDATTAALRHPDMPAQFVEDVMDPELHGFEKHFGGESTAFGHGNRVWEIIARNPDIHHKIKPETVRKLVSTEGFGWTNQFMRGPHGSPELLDAALTWRNPRGMHPLENALHDESPHVRPRHLQQVLDDPSWGPDAKLAAILHPNLPQQDLFDRVKSGVMAADDRAQLGLNGIGAGRLNLQQLRELKAMNSPSQDIREALEAQLKEQDPDSRYPDSTKVGVRLGVAKHRLVRDAILSTGRTEAAPNQLPAGDWSQARLKNGNISADRLQALIDAKPPQTYNFSHSTWDGPQRHSNENSQVFQVNMTTKHLEDMKAAGVYDVFREMHAKSLQSGHPVDQTHGLGWVRWTGTPEKGIFVDEVQSDFGQNWSKTAYSQAKAEGLENGMTEAQAHEHGLKNQAAVDREFPPPDRDKIKDILFGRAHSNEVLTEAFHQWLRDQGHHNTQVHIHSVESKAPISLSEKLPIKCKTCGEPENHEDHNPTDHNEPGAMPKQNHPFVRGKVDISKAPAHFQVTYDQVPKKMGKTPAKYGDLVTQRVDPENPKLRNSVKTGTVTWGGPVRKAEDDLMSAVTESLTNDLRKPKYRESPNPLVGHCYVAAESAYHLMGGAASGYVPQNVRHEGDSHWYLKHRTTGEIIDPTAKQFKTPVPYHLGRGKGFLTREPSARARELMARVRAKTGLQKDEALQKAPYQDASWGAADASRYVGDLRGFKAPEYRGREELAPGIYLHEYDAPFGNKIKSFHVTTTPEPLHEHHRPVDMFVTGYQKPEGFEVNTTVVNPQSQRKGLASLVYRHLARRHGGRLMSGGSQSPEALKLWESLARDPGHSVKFGAPNSYEPHVLTLKSEAPVGTDLQKGVLAPVLAGALSLVSGGAKPHQTPEQALEAAQKVFRPWSPEGLHPELIPIAHLESSFGQNTDHAPNSRGEYYSAHGALGLKAITAHEQYKRTPSLQKLYPGLNDPADFTQKLKSDPQFYNLVGSAHYLWLKKHFGTPEKATFAWRWGPGAAANATPEQVQADPYVQKYKTLAAGVHPSKLVPATMSTGLKND